MEHIQEKMIAAARDCLGTPFHHQGRVALRGLDCIGLIVHALREAGVRVADNTGYGRMPDGNRLKENLLAHGFTETQAAMPGDVLLMRFHRIPQHVGLMVAENAFIHAYAMQRKVIETQLLPGWQARITGIYRLTTPTLI